MPSFTEFETLWNIFSPGDVNELYKIKTNNRRFAYYTSADTAKEIIENKEVWLRSAAVMNDFSEITYGLDLTKKAFHSDSWKIFGDTVVGLGFPDIIEKVMYNFNYWERLLPTEIYLACLSLHDDAEDQNGRLSMWRAYGDVALVINNTPLTRISESDAPGVFSMPVHYLDQTEFEKRLQNVTNAVKKNTTFLHGVGKDVITDCISKMLYLGAIRTKHPGFSEEKEWRIYSHPTDSSDNILTKKIVTIEGVIQEIWKLPLRHDPKNELIHADIPSLIDKSLLVLHSIQKSLNMLSWKF